MDGVFVIDKVFHFAFFDRTTFFDDDIVFSQLAGNKEVLFDQYHGGFCGKLLDGFHELFDQHWRQAFTGFIDQQQVIVSNQRAGNCQHLLLPTGEIGAGQADESFQIREKIENEIPVCGRSRLFCVRQS